METPKNHRFTSMEPVTFGHWKWNMQHFSEMQNSPLKLEVYTGVLGRGSFPLHTCTMPHFCRSVVQVCNGKEPQPRTPGYTSNLSGEFFPSGKIRACTSLNKSRKKYIFAHAIHCAYNYIYENGEIVKEGCAVANLGISQKVTSIQS